MPRQPCVYILASQPRGTHYIGVTSDRLRRIHDHRAGDRSGFPKRYAVHRLVRFELFDDMPNAIAREKQLKNWRRDWKINLIETGNPHWQDMAVSLGFDSPPERAPKRPPPPSC